MTKKQNRFCLQPLTSNVLSKEKKEKKAGRRRRTPLPPCPEQQPIVIFIILEAGGNTDQVWGATKCVCRRVLMCVCAQQRTLWLTRQTLCGLSRQVVRAPELENTFSLRRLPLSQQDAGLLILYFTFQKNHICPTTQRHIVLSFAVADALLGHCVWWMAGLWSK